MSNYHTPVLSHEVIESLNVTAGKTYVDATIGGGGHTLALLKLGAKVIGIDADSAAIDYAGKLFTTENLHQYQLVQGNFRFLEQLVSQSGWVGVSGVIFDLGISSGQLDKPERGFSYRFGESKLDMRFDKEGELTAADILNRSDREDLYEIFATYGEENHSRAISDAIVSARTLKPIVYVNDLNRILGQISGKTMDMGMLSRVYQALRIAVNDELTSLKAGLKAAHTVLETGGRIAVISFHSLEDRIVKLEFKNADRWKEITKKPVRPSVSEIAANSRARSAKLRIAEKFE